MTGFVASTYMRGIHFIQAPTTLLAQVDSSVGGKTGVNHYLGKNMIGTFYQPRLVLIDTATLGSLPRREMIGGMAEVIKYGVISDEGFFDYLGKKTDEIMGLDPDALALIIRRSCEIKSAIVSKDERESGLRAVLNFGHTIGHAVETETRYARFIHGEAVGLGMCLESRLSEALGLLAPEMAAAIEKLIAGYGLPCSLPKELDAGNLLAHMKRDKKVIAGEMTFILPVRIGDVTIRKGIRVADIEGVLLK